MYEFARMRLMSSDNIFTKIPQLVVSSGSIPVIHGTRMFGFFRRKLCKHIADAQAYIMLARDLVCVTMARVTPSAAGAGPLAR